MKKIGKQTMKFDNAPSILDAASIVGEKEGNGPLKKYFDKILNDSMYGEQSWEKAESKIMKSTIETLIKKADVKDSEIDFIFAGDLLNQMTSSVFAVKEFKIPFIGIYAACSTIGEGLALGSIFIDGGYANKIIAAASSHFFSAEKQIRSPLEQGVQRPPSATWTVTGCGALMLGLGSGPYITHATFGKIIDFEINDPYNMGAVMAPGAADVIINHFMDTDRNADYYDLILTGDLGEVGVNILKEMTMKFGYDISDKVKVCGMEIFDLEKQDVDSGGSGCGASASVVSSYILDEIKKENLNKILFVPTGALLSQLSVQQGLNIPSIAYAIAIERSM